MARQSRAHRPPIDPEARRFEEAFALHAKGRTSEALARYDSLLARRPSHAPALHFSALILHELGRSDEALVRIQRSLASDDRVADVWSNAALILMALQRRDEAIDALERALRLEPTLGVAWLNLASLRLSGGDASGAETAARQAIAHAPGAASWFNLTLALVEQGRPAEALAAIEQVVATGEVDARDPSFPGLYAQLLVATGQPERARQVLDLALTKVDHPGLRTERARLFEAAGEHDRAIDDYRAALMRDQDSEPALSELLFMKKRIADWDGVGVLQRVCRSRVAAHAARGDPSELSPFNLLSDPSTRAEQRHAAQAWSRRLVVDQSSRRPVSADRLRIGYLSADFHQHATAVLAAGLFERHDRTRFEVFGYSTGPDDASALRRRLVAGFDRFVDARDWSVDRLAQTIRDDGVDILVDLKGHTERATTAVMARRPAPIAVSYLGYPGTMGASFIDYLIGDATVTPLADAADYDETLVLLPHSYQINDDRRAAVVDVPRAGLGLPDAGLVLCCFNQLYKIGPEVFDVWATILRALPGSVLWLLTRDANARVRLAGELAKRSVPPDRLVFADPRPHAEYLGLYRHADLFLDTWPYNAHTTASDALWAGCPVVTMRGETFAGRVAASLLIAAGLPELIATDTADYVCRVVEFGLSPEKRHHVRARAGRASTTPLFDTGATTRAIESAYREMAAQHRRGRREAIVVPSC